MIQHTARFVASRVRHRGHSGALLAQPAHHMIKFSSVLGTLAPDNTGRLHIGDEDVVSLPNLQGEILELW